MVKPYILRFNISCKRKYKMKKVNLLRWVLLIIIGVLLSGCSATVPVMKHKFDADAKRFQPQQRKANIYVARENAFAGSAILFQVLLDGKVHGAIAPGTYLLFKVTPGSHTVAVITQENADSAKIAVRPGKNYFIEIKPEMGWVAARVSVKQIGKERGRQLVIDGKRAELLIAE